MRELMPHELAQIAGRAGRHTNAGTFGVTGRGAAADEGVAEAIMEHRFAPVKGSGGATPTSISARSTRLIASLEERTDDEWLTRGREADDLMALKALAEGRRSQAASRCARRAAFVGRLPHPRFPRASAMPNMPICWAHLRLSA
jgi:ATP-dependent RNA helicase SUPV3L1/SUV3